MLKEGDFVRHKETGIIGKITFSTFGYSIHYRNEHGKRNQVLAASEEYILKHWDKCNAEGELID